MNMYIHTQTNGLGNLRKVSEERSCVLNTNYVSSCDLVIQFTLTITHDQSSQRRSNQNIQ